MHLNRVSDPPAEHAKLEKCGAHRRAEVLVEKHATATNRSTFFDDRFTRFEFGERRRLERVSVHLSAGPQQPQGHGSASIAAAGRRRPAYANVGGASQRRHS
jgi:hypothetical protein